MAGLDNNTQLLINCQEPPNNSQLAYDTSKNAFTVTVNGNTPNVIITSGTGTKFGKGFTTGGTGDGTDDNFLSIGTNAVFAFGTGDWTVDFWAYFVNKTGSQNPQCLVELDGPANGISCFKDGTNDEIECTINAQTVTETWVHSSSTLYHLAYVRSGDTLSMYVNGTRVGSGTSVAGKSVSNSNGVRIGQNFAETQQSDCIFSEIRISDVARWTGASFTVPVSPYSSTGIHSHI